MKKFIVIIALLFSLTTSLHSQWIKQNWPAGSVNGVGFFNQNTGIVAVGSYPTIYIYRTTNSGYNWVEIKRMFSYFAKVQLIDSNVMYIGGSELTSGYDKIYKTTDKGVTFDSSIVFGYLSSLECFHFINKDTGWAEVFNGDRTTLFKTTNGGLNFPEVSYTGSGFPFAYVLHFLKEQYNGYYHGYRSDVDRLEKTTNSGLSWFPLPLLPTDVYDKPDLMNDIRQITFINKDTGWVTNGKPKIYKTTNGGSNWIVQPMPGGGYIFDNLAFSFKIINPDTLYSDGGVKYYGGNKVYGIIFKTTNGGLNWGYQQPDTSINPICCFGYPFFINSNTGWFSNIKTTNGGGPIIYTEIKNIIVEHPTEYKLIQNYPNPFNPSTTIDFYLPKRAGVNLSIYDISGKRVYTVINNFPLINGYHSYRIDAFETLGLSSGTYFYRIEAYDIGNNSALFTNTKKMLYIK